MLRHRIPEVPYRAVRVLCWDNLEINEFLFVDVALRAASTLKNLTFFDLLNVLEVSKHNYLVGFEHQEYARTLSFEKICRMH